MRRDKMISEIDGISPTIVEFLKNMDERNVKPPGRLERMRRFNKAGGVNGHQYATETCVDVRGESLPIRSDFSRDCYSIQ
jgi:hypothetical protein